jgi:hypothetical protein
MGRGAVNQKGRKRRSWRVACDSRRGRKIPVNLVLVAEGEEEIGSPNFPQIVLAPEVRSALSKSLGVFMPSAEQEWDGSVVITLGNKGDIECDLIASGEKWGRGPTRDVHSSLAARVDQPGVASRAGAEHARDAERRSGDRRLLRERCGRSRRPSTRCSTSRRRASMRSS